MKLSIRRAVKRCDRAVSRLSIAWFYNRFDHERAPCRGRVPWIGAGPCGPCAADDKRRTPCQVTSAMAYAMSSPAQPQGATWDAIGVDSSTGEPGVKLSGKADHPGQRGPEDLEDLAVRHGRVVTKLEPLAAGRPMPARRTAKLHASTLHARTCIDGFHGRGAVIAEGGPAPRAWQRRCRICTFSTVGAKPSGDEMPGASTHRPAGLSSRLRNAQIVPSEECRRKGCDETRASAANPLARFFHRMPPEGMGARLARLGQATLFEPRGAFASCATNFGYPPLRPR